MKNKAFLICIGLIFILISGIVYIIVTPTDHVVYHSDRDNASVLEEVKINQELNSESEEKVSLDVDNTEDILHNNIIVYICGSVQNEGVYSLNEGARVFEALDLAGGLTEEAKSDYINLARVLEDGESIYFPNQDEVEGLTFNQWEGQDLEQSTCINLNQASESELTELPGIGTAKAKAIIAYREKNNRFESIEQIMEVPGIKENTFEIIKELISI
jgi:competence protein ComEA